MRKFAALCVALMLVGPVIALAAVGPCGPAPNSGDGVSDGSGLEAPFGANEDRVGGGDAFGPAPQSGDGVSDGSGLDAPNGPKG